MLHLQQAIVPVETRFMERIVRCLSAVSATEFAKPVCVKERPGGGCSLSPRERARVRGNDASTAAACRLSAKWNVHASRCYHARAAGQVSVAPAVFPLALRAGRSQTCVRLLRFGSLREQFAQRWLITTMTVT